MQLDLHFSDQLNSSDDDAEEADFSLSLHKKEMPEREDDDEDAFSNNESDGPPDLPSSSSPSVDDEQDDQDSQDLIRESALVFESNDYKQSRRRLAEFTEGQ